MRIVLVSGGGFDFERRITLMSRFVCFVCSFSFLDIYPCFCVVLLCFVSISLRVVLFCIVFYCFCFMFHVSCFLKLDVPSVMTSTSSTLSATFCILSLSIALEKSDDIVDIAGSFPHGR